jgi:protein SCO1/2
MIRPAIQSPPLTMNRKLAYFLGGVFGAPLLALLAFVTIQPIKVLPRLMLAPGYALTDQSGDTLSSEDLRGQIALYSVTYSNCAEPCPPSTELMRSVQSELLALDLKVPVKLVTVSVDAERDTPGALRAFGERLGADFSRWSFLTGDEARLRQVVGGSFGMYYSRQPDGGYALDTRLWLVDGWGLVRAEYSTRLPGLSRVMRDIRLVADEAANSVGVARYAYEAAHLFGCYSR